MLEPEHEMTFAERIEGPLGPTVGAPARLCWKIAEATLAGPLMSRQAFDPARAARRNFGQNAQYGTLLQQSCTTTGGSSIESYQDFRHILRNPCPRS